MAFRGLLSFLTAPIRRAFPYIDMAVRLRQPIARIRRAIGARIAGVSAADLERVVSATRAARRTTEEIVGGNLKEKISPTRIPSAITRQRRRFAWRIRYNYVDPTTGEFLQKHMTLSTDEIISAEDALDQARDIIAENYGIEHDATFDLAITRITSADERGIL